MAGTFDARVLRHWKVLGLVLIAVLALASGVYAYWRINAPRSPTLYVTATSPPLELRMELDKAEFGLNETIAIHLFLRNIGERAIKIYFPYINTGGVGFIVEYANGTEVFNFPRGGLASVDEVTLELGGQISKTLNWSQIGRRLVGDVIVGTYSVPSGTYYIIGRTEPYLIDVDIATATPPWTPLIQTPPIAITIS